MSLINDALKKAQKQRSGELPPLGSIPSVGGERPADLSPRARRASGAPAALFLWIGVGTGGLAAVAAAAFFLLRAKPAAPAAAPAHPPAVNAAVTPVVATPAPAPAGTVSVQSAPARENVFVLPAAPAVTTAKPAPGQTEAHPLPSPAAPAAAPSPTPVAPAVADTARPGGGRIEPRAIQFIDSIRVAGIRVSATDSKVLMNDRVYRIGSTVEHEMGLRLVEITSNSLTFEDDHGARYTRNF